MKEKRTRIIVIVGPTASGKSDLALRLVLWLRKQAKHPERVKRIEGLPTDTEIISADSRQVYRGLDIGTGKVTKKEQKLVPHWLIDVANPKNPAVAGFTVDNFKKMAEQAIKDIVSRGKIPIVVGGTGLYIDALVYGINFPEVPPNPKLRLNFNRLSAEKLFDKLRKIDPKRAETIEPKNKRRLIRALEILESGQKIPVLDTRYNILDTRYSVLWLGLNPKDLYERISKRLDQRLKKGLIAEIKHLLYSHILTNKRIDELGLAYREVPRYLRGEIKKEEMRNNILKSEINYAKRQMTWFKRNKKIKWLRNEKEAMRLCRSFLGRHHL
ncbi:MAG: tRNA dimethylallyltransferase [Candidatus Yanofskybacteria bacterium GW2011_GWA1_48_10]|uniref:tRNA dimethylallyltransferase n=2 Tax=Candidatus Yanofskyibacteriota TaxID=1752733 RepID=A0A0G1U6G4_9BACT|nr:MAG: tRNA dimethylallyltransferase [Candidatus Yanofskybacteria bacterium GW2011_GWA1_48_10]OGN06141.1 MAG: tRNA (adenosine(37)-N6)-dimethylallyltransferase MiaA [Candidatus Yanofskybacteria bacterium RIFCSPHIGHO2_01_FULL_48_25b]